MATCFTEINASDVQKCFPKFYDRRGRFFEIVHTDASGQGQPIGFVGVRPLRLRSLRSLRSGQALQPCSGLPSAQAGGQAFYEDCELEVFIFKQYRNALSKGTVLAVLDLPKTLNFKRCWMKTTKKTVVKLLTAMKKYGITHVGRMNQPTVGPLKHVFILAPAKSGGRSSDEPV
jgi:hypothetical protein